ncbi:DUF4255 domain-containing protein [Cryptosporangium arvum]|uniref:DUF4255 domain-containing protein n=1 Tax=Cryptosporangium arvum TaxID=80871 RepID=UPI0004B99E0F|nr:DUF4255 domain-containing protein [Cryptosporangium arvum]
MINDVDQVLRTLLTEIAAPAGAGDVVFDAPTRDWAARRTGPTVNAYLYEIQEDLARRERGAIAIRDENGRVVGRRQPPRWFRLTYLVTAWTTRPEDEHRLLSAVLRGLLPRETVPLDDAPAALAALGVALPITVGVPPEQSRSIADIWSALGGELKPSLDITVVVPFPVSPEYPTAPVVTEPLVADVRVRE